LCTRGLLVTLEMPWRAIRPPVETSPLNPRPLFLSPFNGEGPGVRFCAELPRLLRRVGVRLLGARSEGRVVANGLTPDRAATLAIQDARRAGDARIQRHGRVALHHRVIAARGDARTHGFP